MPDVTTQPDVRNMSSRLMRGAIWIAIGALIAAALVCVVWVLIGNQDGIIGRAFLTILLLAVFAGIAIAESNLAVNRPDWLVLTSMITWIIALLVGAAKIWLPEEERFGGWGVARFIQLLAVVAILQLALVHVRLYLKASQRYVTAFTSVIVIVTFTMLGMLVAMLVFFLTMPDQFEYRDLYWRIVIAMAILVAVGTTLIPLLNALFAPREHRAQAPGAQQAIGYAPQALPATSGQVPWPTYADGQTPLPVMPDGSPDWNAYYTGYPTYAAQSYVTQGQGFPTLDAGVESAGNAIQDAGAAAPWQQESQAATVPPAPEQPVSPVPSPTTDPVEQAPQAPAEQAPQAPANQEPPAPSGLPAPPAYGSYPPPPAEPGAGQ